MKKLSELIIAVDHLRVFLEANLSEEEIEQVEEITEMVNEVVEEIVKPTEPEEVKEQVDINFLKDDTPCVEEPVEDTAKRPEDMNWHELREWYKENEKNKRVKR